MASIWLLETKFIGKFGITIDEAFANRRLQYAQHMAKVLRIAASILADGALNLAAPRNVQFAKR